MQIQDLYLAQIDYRLKVELSYTKGKNANTASLKKYQSKLQKHIEKSKEKMFCYAVFHKEKNSWWITLTYPFWACNYQKQHLVILCYTLERIFAAVKFSIRTRKPLLCNFLFSVWELRRVTLSVNFSSNKVALQIAS